MPLRGALLDGLTFLLLQGEVLLGPHLPVLIQV